MAPISFFSIRRKHIVNRDYQSQTSTIKVSLKLSIISLLYLKLVHSIPNIQTWQDVGINSLILHLAGLNEIWGLQLLLLCSTEFQYFYLNRRAFFGETDSKEAIKIIVSTFNGPWGSEQMKSELKVRSRPREWWGQEQACDHFTAVNAQRKAAEQTQVVQSEGKALVHIPHSAFILEGLARFKLKPANEPAYIWICIMLTQANSNHYRLTVTIHFWSFLLILLIP